MKVGVDPGGPAHDEKEYDVSCCCDKLFCGFVKLFLGENEVDLHIVSCLGISDNRKRIPYGELSGVDKQQICGCFYSFGGGKLNQGTVVFFDQSNSFLNDLAWPRFGCDEQYVDEIVGELKKRQTNRGDTGNIQRIEENSKRIARVEEKIDAILAHLKVNVETMERGPETVEVTKQ